MKKTLLTLLVAIIANVTFGQSVNFGIKAGINMSDQTYGGITAGMDLKHQYTPGFNAGAIVNIDFLNFTLQPGLTYTTKGEKITQQQTTSNPVSSYVVPATTYTLNYLETSLNGLFNIHAAPGAIIQLGGGIFGSQGLSAHRGSEKASFNKDDQVFVHYQNPDYGLKFIAGIKLKKQILVDVSYSLGLADISTNDTKMKNRVFGLSAGYLFK